MTPPRVVIDGFLILNKPVGMTSNRALQIVKRLYNAKKAGFVGTLDPFASGMLPICFGKATKLSEKLHEFPKTYIAELKLGAATSTGDTEGEVIETLPVPDLSPEGIEAAMQGFRVKIKQVPPMFSALKREGKPLYELARQGIVVDRPAREVEVYSLECLSVEAAILRFKVSSSKGFYVRTLGEDLAKALGTCGHLMGLYRQDCAGFSKRDMVELPLLQLDHASKLLVLPPVCTMAMLRHMPL